LPLASTPAPWQPTESSFAGALLTAPVNTRANIRSAVMRQIAPLACRYFVDWEIVDAEGVNSLNLINPFESDPIMAEYWLSSLKGTLRA
jgi:hypothetical protein